MAEHFTACRRAAILCVFVVLACREKNSDKVESLRASLPPVYPAGPAATTNWDPSAGPVMLVSLGDDPNSAAIILPELTDSTVAAISDSSVVLTGLAFDLLGRGGKIGSSAATPVEKSSASRQCVAWPTARLRSASPGWRVGMVGGGAKPLALDSIEGMASADSAALAAALTQTVATLPIAADPTFRRLPFRVRFAYRIRVDSVEVVVSDVVRALNEEANPRIEHILLIAERIAGTTGKYNVGYYSRTAGAEETMQATEVLAAIEIGVAKRPAFVVNGEGEQGNRLGLIERTGFGVWRPIWWSASTGC
jgi:hypothetical protein